MGAIHDAISGYLNKIHSAILGHDVRDSIESAISTIALQTDYQLQEFASVVNTANDIATEYQNTSTSVAEARTEANKITQKISDFDDEMDSLAAPNITMGDYTYNQNTNNWTPATVSVSYDKTTHRFSFTFPKGPYVSNAPTVMINDEIETPSAEFNPKNGTFKIVLPNLIRQLLNSMTVTITNIAPDANNQYLVDGEPVSPSGVYDPVHNELNLNLFQGLNGTGAVDAFNAMGARPFILADLYVTQNSQFTNRYWFPCQSLVSHNSVVDQETGKVVVNGANDFDAALIIFRKSTNNNSGDTLNNNYNGAAKEINAALLGGNTDFDSTTTLFIRKPLAGETSTSATASFVDASGRLLTRRVRWLAEPHYFVISGGAQKAYPSRRFIPQSEYDASVVNGTSPLGTKIGDSYTSAFLFENAKIGANGDLSEYVKLKNGTYSNSSYWDKKFNPVTNRELNKRYNQVMIPARIIGISFAKTTSAVNQYIH